MALEVTEIVAKMSLMCGQIYCCFVFHVCKCSHFNSWDPREKVTNVADFADSHVNSQRSTQRCWFYNSDLCELFYISTVLLTMGKCTPPPPEKKYNNHAVNQRLTQKQNCRHFAFTKKVSGPYQSMARSQGCGPVPSSTEVPLSPPPLP